MNELIHLARTIEELYNQPRLTYEETLLAFKCIEKLRKKALDSGLDMCYIRNELQKVAPNIIKGGN